MTKNLNKKYLVVKVRQGLANRIICIVSAMRLAKIYGRELIVIWSKEDACPCYFEELFEATVKVYRDLPGFLNHKRKGDFAFGELTNLKECLMGVDFSKLSERVLFLDSVFFNYDIKDYEIAKTFKKLDKNWSGGNNVQVKIIHTFGAILTHLEKDLHPYLISLKPKNSISLAVERFAKKNFDKKTIGVHIRGTDNRLTLHFNNLFLNIIKEEVSKGKRIFLACDDGRVLNQAIKIAGKKIIYFPKRYNVRKLRQSSMEDAFIDLLLLSKTKEIYKAPFSSFSLVSAAYNKIPIHYVYKKDGSFFQIICRSLNKIINRTLGKIGKSLKENIPWLYRKIKPHFPDR